MTQDLNHLLEEKSAVVDRALERFLRDDPWRVENLHDGVLYALGLDQDDPAARGKRIRPALCLIACGALEGDENAALPFAMAIELMHNFFLVHDDIQDGDQFRRGRPSVWKHYGIPHAINIGDFLLTKVFAAFLSESEKPPEPQTQTALYRLLIETLEVTHVGQAQDMNALQSRAFTVEQYLEIVTNKTGYYLAAPMLGGAIIAGATPETIRAIRALGKCVGPVFQIVDDTIDLTHGKGRERVGSDIREGKRSYLVAHAASRATEQEQAEMFRILDLPREATSPEHVEWMRGLFEKTGAIEAGRNCCRRLMDQARDAMAAAPPPLRDILLDIFESLLERKR